MVLDHNVAVIARNLIFFHLLNEAFAENDVGKRRLAFHILAYLFPVSILPPLVWEKLQMAISALLKNLEDRSRPTPWASVVEEDIKPLCRVLKQWQPVPDGSFSTQNIRLLVG